MAKKANNEGEKTPIYKKKWFWIVIAVILIIGIIGNREDASKDEDTIISVSSPYEESDESEQKVAEDVDGTPQDITEESFISAIWEAIAGDVNTERNEVITDVTLTSSDLCVFVDFSDANLEYGNLTMTKEDLAYSRTSSITDSILELSEYDSLWDTITVDFGDVGYIQNSKENIIDSEYGRYFDSATFELIGGTDTATQTEEAEETAEEISQTTYILNTSTMKFHYASCTYVKKIDSANYGEFTGTREDLIARGYSPCGHCNP